MKINRTIPKILGILLLNTPVISAQQIVKIPELNKTLTIPTTWTIATVEMLDSHTLKKTYPTPEAKQTALSKNQLLGTYLIATLAQPEPTTKRNAKITIVWTYMLLKIQNLPPKEKKQLLLKNTLPTLENQTALEQPNLLKNAIATRAEFQSPDHYLNGEKGETLTTIYYIIEGNKLILIEASYDLNEKHQYQTEVENIITSLSP